MKWANGVPNGSNGGPCVPIQALVNSIPAAIGPEEWVHGPQKDITPAAAIGAGSSIRGPAVSPNNPCGDGQYFSVTCFPFSGTKSASVRDSAIHLTQHGNNA